MAKNRKPRLFIGSSREAIPYAEAIAASLEHVVEINAWFATTFETNDYTMEALERELDANDFGVFVFAAEDIATIRGDTYFITRDNTLFEMGLFWGRLGRSRVFCVIPRNVPPAKTEDGSIISFHLPSDLDGLNLLRYGEHSRGPKGSVLTPCAEIKTVIEREGFFLQRHEIISEQAALLERKDSVLNFLYEYLRNVTIKDTSERYAGYSEAIRNSFLAPAGFRTMGAALWKQVDEEHITQVGGNVGRGKTFLLSANDGKRPEEHIIVVRAHQTNEWSFFTRREIADVHVLCYPLDREHVLSVHFSGNRVLTDEQLAEIVVVNDDLLVTICTLVGGDSR